MLKQLTHTKTFQKNLKSLEAKMGEYTITEEDAELVQAISASITTFKQQYEGAFAIMNPQVQQGAR